MQRAKRICSCAEQLQTDLMHASRKRGGFYTVWRKGDSSHILPIYACSNQRAAPLRNTKAQRAAMRLYIKDVGYVAAIKWNSLLRQRGITGFFLLNRFKHRQPPGELHTEVSQQINPFQTGARCKGSYHFQRMTSGAQAGKLARFDAGIDIPSIFDRNNRLSIQPKRYFPPFFHGKPGQPDMACAQ